LPIYISCHPANTLKRQINLAKKIIYINLAKRQ
jgi:hypothetical protein